MAVMELSVVCCKQVESTQSSVLPPCSLTSHPCCSLFAAAQQNMKKYFSFEVQVLDDKNVRRRFRASNYQVARRAGNLTGITHSCSHPGLCSAASHSRRGPPSTTTSSDAALRRITQPFRLAMHAAVKPSATIHWPACLRLHLPAEHDPRQAIHLHHADAPG